MSERFNKFKTTQKILAQRSHDLNERGKELECHYSVSKLAGKLEVSLDVLFKRTVKSLSVAYQYPEITCVRITYEDQQYTTDFFQETQWRQGSEIRVDDKIVGAVEVFYLEERAPQAEGPFLDEERKLIDSIAQLLSDWIRNHIVQEKLINSEKRFRSLIENSYDVVLILDENGIITYANPSLQNVGGFTESDVIGHSFFDFVHPDDKSLAEKNLYKAVHEKDAIRQANIRCRHQSGRWVNVESLAVNALDNEAINGIVIYAHDITDRIKKEKRIESLTRIHAVLSNINATIVRVRQRDELFQEACRIAVEHGKFLMAWVGLVDKDSLKINPVAWNGHVNGYLDEKEFTLNEDDPEGHSLTARTLRKGALAIRNDIESTTDFHQRDAALARGYKSVAILPLNVADTVIGVFSLYSNEPGFFDDEEVDLLKELAADISFALDHIDKAESINYLAYYDVLTGLPNLDFFIEQINQHIQQVKINNKVEAMVLLNIDRFHNIKETFGRSAADHLLKIIAKRLQQFLTENVTLARPGGDRFVIYFSKQENIDSVTFMVEKLISHAFKEKFHIEDTELKISARAGIAIYPNDGNDCDTLLKNAESALLKSNISTTVMFYSPDMNARAGEFLKLENKLHQAIEKENFKLFYQPKIDTISQQIVGLEALIRWDDPEQGMVQPGDFIPLLESTGLIIDVGYWVITQALSDCKKWRKEGFHSLKIAVNISPLQLRQKDFVSMFEKTLDRVSGAPHCLDIEITESVIMDDIEKNITILSALKEMGINTAIDDFGTGYSSLFYISKLPVNALKIDREFISNMTLSADAMTIVNMILNMAHNLDLKVIAEGVETEEQIKLLQLLKCDELQGYYYSKPLPFDEMGKLLAKNDRML